MDDWLSASFDASNPVTHWVDARLGWVDLDDVLELLLASVELASPELTVWLALLHDKWLWILTVLKHLVDVVWSLDVWSNSSIWDVPSWGKPSGNSSSHFLFLVLSNL